MSFRVYQNFTRPAVDSFVSYELLTMQSAEYLTEFRWTYTGCSDFVAVLHFVIFLLSRLISAVRRLSCSITVFLYWTSTHRIPCTDTCSVRALTREWYGCFFLKPVACLEWCYSRWSKKGLQVWERLMYSFIESNDGMLSKHSARNNRSVGIGITCSAAIFTTTLVIHSFQFQW